jgi:hypothetical protein
MKTHPHKLNTFRTMSHIFTVLDDEFDLDIDISKSDCHSEGHDTGERHEPVFYEE